MLLGTDFSVDLMTQPPAQAAFSEPRLQHSWTAILGFGQMAWRPTHSDTTGSEVSSDNGSREF
jgi:hypothetical protein